MGDLVRQHRAEPVSVEYIIEQNQSAPVSEYTRLSSVDCPESQGSLKEAAEGEAVFSLVETSDMILEYYLDSW